MISFSCRCASRAWDGASITTVFEVLRAQETLVTGQLRHVCISAETFAKTEIPDWVRSGLAGYLDDDSQRAAGL